MTRDHCLKQTKKMQKNGRRKHENLMKLNKSIDLLVCQTHHVSVQLKSRLGMQDELVVTLYHTFGHHHQNSKLPEVTFAL